jgi:hypothetical protein
MLACSGFPIAALTGGWLCNDGRIVPIRCTTRNQALCRVQVLSVPLARLASVNGIACKAEARAGWLQARCSVAERRRDTDTYPRPRRGSIHSPKTSEAHGHMSKPCGNFERGGSGLFILRNDCRVRPFYFPHAITHGATGEHNETLHHAVRMHALENHNVLV